MSYVDFFIGIVIGTAVLNAFGMRVLIIASGAAQVVGYAIQALYRLSNGFWPLIIGGMIIDMTRAFVWLATPTFVARWFEAERKSIAYGTIFVSAGFFALGIVALVRYTIENSDEYRDFLIWYLLAFWVAAVVLFVTSIVAFTEAPRAPPGPQSDENEKKKNKVKQPGNFCTPKWPEENRAALITIMVVYIIAVGPTWATSSLALAIMNNHGYSNSDISLVAVCALVASMPTPLITGALQSTFKQYRWIAFVTVLLSAGIFTGIPFVLDDRNAFIGLITTFMFVTGAFSVTFMECAVELAFPVPEWYATSIMFSGAQISGVLCTLLASFDATFTAAMWVFFGLLWGAVVVMLIGQLLFNGTYARSKQQQKQEQYPLRRDIFPRSTTLPPRPDVRR